MQRRPAVRAQALLVPVLLAILALALAGCGGSKGSSTSTAGSSTVPSTGSSNPSTTPAKPLRVGLVTDIGGLNDRSFNHLAYVGLLRAESQLGVQGRVLTSKSASDYIPNLSALANQHYDLIIAVGFLMADPLATVAKQFPNVKFAIVDFSAADLKGQPKNVEGLVFKEQEAGYLVGYLSGLVERQRGGPQVVGSVGGQKIPPVDHYIAGFQAGAKAADPGVKTLNGYSQDFADQAKCKEEALNQIAQGSDIEFQVAGGCGLGTLDAAREKGAWGIGVDADQSYLGPHILTSALKKVDVAVFDAIQGVRGHGFKGGQDLVFDAKNGGVGIGRISAKVPQAMRAKLAQVKARLAAGQIAVPDTVK